MKPLLTAAEIFEPREPAVSAARSLLAFAELSVLVVTPDRILFGITPNEPPARLCSGVGALSLWCVTGAGSEPYSPGRVIAVAILGCVVLGLWPRWLCVPHWYVAFSLAVRTVAPDGGDDVAQILTLLLIPVSLGDMRTCHWQRPDTPMAPGWRGSAYAGHLLLRCQIAIIYLDASLSKLAFHSWRSGTAVPILLSNPQFGLIPEVRQLAQRLLAPVWVSAPITWTVIAIEMTIALTMLFGARARRAALALAVCLHSAIIVVMGLFSFGLIMISLVMAVSGGDLRQQGRATLTLSGRTDTNEIVPGHGRVHSHSATMKE